MIGDWVLFGNEPHKVLSVDSENAVFLDLEYNLIHVDLIKPVPITQEILKKNGFRTGMYSYLELGDSEWLEYYHHECRLRMWWGGLDEWENHSQRKEIIFQCSVSYVHELQHALRLCNINKEIEL